MMPRTLLAEIICLMRGNLTGNVISLTLDPRTQRAPGRDDRRGDGVG